VTDLVPARHLAELDAGEIAVSVLEPVEAAIQAAHILLDELRQPRMLRQLVVEISPLELMDQIVVEDRPRENDGCDTNGPAEVREPVSLLRAGLGPVDVYDLVVLPVAGPFADLSPAPLPVGLDQGRDDLDQAA
jgi:hypothetical protein